MKPLFGNWKEVALALALDGGDDVEIIAKGLMNGETRYTQEELEQLAAHKGMTVDDLLLYPEFDTYRTAEYERKRIAANILKKGFNAELAAELTNLPIRITQHHIDIAK